MLGINDRRQLGELTLSVESRGIGKRLRESGHPIGEVLPHRAAPRSTTTGFSQTKTYGVSTRTSSRTT